MQSRFGLTHLLALGLFAGCGGDPSIEMSERGIEVLVCVDSNGDIVLGAECGEDMQCRDESGLVLEGVVCAAVDDDMDTDSDRDTDTDGDTDSDDMDTDSDHDSDTDHDSDSDRDSDSDSDSSGHGKRHGHDRDCDSDSDSD